MPTITIKRSDVRDVIEALQAELGGQYSIEPGSKPGSLTVKGGPLTTAHVQLNDTGDGTSVAVSPGGGFLISQRIRNSRGIARDVADAIERSSRLR